MNPYKKQRHKGQGQGKPRRRKLATPARKDPSELPDKTKLHLKAAPRSAELGHHFVYSELPFLLQDLPDTALVIILDHITDVGNFGAIIRSAEVVGASGLVIPANRSASVSEATFRTSAGAVEHLPIAKVANLVQAIQALKEADFWIAAADQHAAQDIWQSNLKGRIGLVLGAEDSGISERVATACDFSFRLPQRGHTESLNVSAAAAAIAFEWMRQNFDQGQAPA